MIINNSVQIKMNGKHISKYRNKGYVCNVGQTIEVKIEDIPNYSQIKVDVICDLCKCCKKIFFNSYVKSILNGGYYSCIKCVKDKKIKTNLEKYGFEYPMQSSITKEKCIKTSLDKYGFKSPNQSEYVKCKSKKTNLEKYGVENPFQSGEIKNKIKQKNLEKYGFEFYSQTNESKEKCIKTNLKKYGVKFFLQSEEIKEKIKKTNLKKYGVENPFQDREIKEKIKKTNLKKYGFEYANQSDIVKDKIKKTNLKKYGFENSAQSDQTKKKIKESRINNGSWISDELKSSFEIYENDVYNKTLLLKNLIFDTWKGYDYYDSEYIKDNINLPHTDPKYPTIDHKISTYYGFNNNINTSEIASIDNICITKRSINSIKNRLTEYEFKIKQ